MRGRGAYPDKAPSQAQARAQFELWLYGARPERVLAATVDSCAAMHRCDRRWMEAKLLARQDVLRRGVA